MLYVLTVGIIPADCTSDYQFEVLVDDEAGQTPLNLSYTVTTIEGWVAGVVSLLPGWELDFIPQGHSCGRAFNTAINELSDSRSK
jgi:hypothetical protein